eukprot:1160822-Pelagomonas_calceolata.AAC.3
MQLQAIIKLRPCAAAICSIIGDIKARAAPEQGQHHSKGSIIAMATLEQWHHQSKANIRARAP